MPLDPDLAAFLELVEAGVANGAKPLHEMPITEARRQYDASTLALDSPAMAVASVRPIRIPCRDGNEIDEGFMRRMFLRASSLCPRCCISTAVGIALAAWIPMTLYAGRSLL